MVYYSGHPEYKNSGPGESRAVSALIYGCMELARDWSKNSLAEMPPPYRKERVALAIDLLECCFANGINFFDHADIYGCGKSEEIFAAAIRELQIPREQYILQGKCGIVLPDSPQQTAYYDFSGPYLVQQVEACLKRLDTDYLDVLLLHRPDSLVEPEEVAAAFTRLQQQGKVLAFGVSNHSAAQIALLQEYLPFALAYNQMQISLHHHELLSSGLEYNTPNPLVPYFDVTDYCRLKKLRLQAWSPVARGKLFAKNPQEPKTTGKAVQSALERLSRLHDCSPASLAFAWLLRHPAGIQPIIGSTKVQRVAEACKACDIRLEKREWYDLLVAARERNLP